MRGVLIVFYVTTGFAQATADIKTVQEKVFLGADNLIHQVRLLTGRPAADLVRSTSRVYSLRLSARSTVKVSSPK